MRRARPFAPSLSRDDSRQLVRSLVTLGGPIALQNLIGSSLNMLDTVMIGSLGTAQIAGVAIANQIFFLLNLFLFGTGSGTAVFTAQYWGNRDLAGIRRSLGACLVVTMSGALLVFALSQAIPRQLIALFSPDPEVIGYGSRFLRVVSIGFLFQGVSAGYIYVLRSVERTRMALVAGAASLALNTFLNWCLIFGHLGAPALGVEGSGIATATARFVELAIVIAAVYRRKSRSPLAARPREMFRLDPYFFRKFVAVILPVVGNEVGWALGLVVEMAVFGHMGTASVAAYNIADTAIKLVIVVFFGTTNANAIIVGKRIGQQDRDGAVRAAGFCMRLAPALGAVLGGVLAALSLVVPGLFNVDPQVRLFAATAMVIYGCGMPLRMFNWHMIVGIMRAGGDTRFAMAMDVGGTWLVSIPLVAVAGLLLGAPFWLVYVATMMEDIPKAIIGVRRVRSLKWLNDLTGRPAPEAQPPVG
jgi:putative MATE family efflux protein